jgi:endonuclease/exonuclease/phosphatase family metal-dependent hydrolase
MNVIRPVRTLFLVTLFFGLAGCRTASKPQIPASFRIMTYNIRHGEGLDGKIDLLRIAEVIKREGADIVALQEVDKGVERTARGAGGIDRHDQRF